MQNRRKRSAQRSKRPAARRVGKAKEHSTVDLYLHGLAGVIGLGILVIPFFVALVYGGGFSMYLVIGAGFIALLLAMLIYDISLTHSHDPYNFLKATSGKEYSFIFGFLLLVSFIITATAAGIASVGELSLFFGVGTYTSIAAIDVAFLIIWILFFYNKVRRSLNFAGALKIFFILLLIIVGAIATFRSGAIGSISMQSSVLPYTPPVFFFGLLLLLWMYGGFEGASIVYKGEDRTKVAKAIIYIIITSIILFSVIQVFTYTSVNTSITSIYSALAANLPTASIFTTNIISSSMGAITEDILVALSIVVILSAAFAVVNASNRTLDDMSNDGLMPKFLAKDENLKLLVTAAVPMVLITIFSSAVISTSVFDYIAIIIISALAFAAAFAFFAAGYAAHYLRQKKYSRMLFGIFTAILMILLIVFSPVAFLIGLAIILLVAVIGYALIK